MGACTLPVTKSFENFSFYEIIYLPELKTNVRLSSGLIPATSYTQLISVTPKEDNKSILLFTRTVIPNKTNLIVYNGNYYVGFNVDGENYSGCNVITRIYGYYQNNDLEKKSSISNYIDIKNRSILANNQDSITIDITNTKASLFTITGYCANINSGGFSFSVPYRNGVYCFPIYNTDSLIYLLSISVSEKSIIIKTFYSGNTSLYIYISYVTMFY